MKISCKICRSEIEKDKTYSIKIKGDTAKWIYAYLLDGICKKCKDRIIDLISEERRKYWR